MKIICGTPFILFTFFKVFVYIPDMKVKVLIFVCCLSVSFAAEIVDDKTINEPLKPLNRKARLIGLGGIGGAGIIGGIAIVGGGVKGFGGPG